MYLAYAAAKNRNAEGNNERYWSQRSEMICSHQDDCEEVERAVLKTRSTWKKVSNPHVLTEVEKLSKRAIYIGRTLQRKNRNAEGNMSGIGASQARRFSSHSDECEEVERAVLNALIIALKTRDADTYDHSRRTVKISLLLGRECGLDYREMRSLEFGALLHDIGKIGVPDSVLRKPGKLNDFEWAMMRRHPFLGAGDSEWPQLPGRRQDHCGPAS